MDKQAWIAVTLCLVGLVAWQIYFSSKYPPVPVAPKTAAAVAGATPGAGATPAPAKEAVPTIISGKPDFVDNRKEAASPSRRRRPAAPEQTEVVTTPQIELHFTSWAAASPPRSPWARRTWSRTARTSGSTTRAGFPSGH